MVYADKMISADLVQIAIAEYQSKSRHPDLKAFEVSELEPVDAAAARAARQSGVYVLYREDRSLIYVGMSTSDIAKRIKQHMSDREQASDYWSTRKPYLCQTVIVPYSWEGPSLEEYLNQWAEKQSG